MQKGETGSFKAEPKPATVSNEILALLGGKIDSLTHIRERIGAINQKLTGGEFLTDKPAEGKSCETKSSQPPNFLVEITRRIERIGYIGKEIEEFLTSLERVF